MYKLPDLLLSWAWTAAYLRSKNEYEQTESGLILPGAIANQSEEPALVHFSRMVIGGAERSWLWLFDGVGAGVSLKMVPRYAEGAEADIIEATLPPPPPGEPSPVVLHYIDVPWLRGLPLSELGIHEVWVGFDYKRFARDRNLRSCTDAIMSAEEFGKIARR